MPKGKVDKKDNQNTNDSPKSRFVNGIDEDSMSPVSSGRGSGNSITVPRKRTGGFFSAIKRLFGFGKKDEAQGASGIDNDLDSTFVEDDGSEDSSFDESIDDKLDNDNVIDFNDGDEVGENPKSAWDLQANKEDFVADKPDEGSFLFKWSRIYNEPIRRRPVFESSAFWRSDGMHSHMALRFSRFNKNSGRLERRRVGLGYASQGQTPRGTGKLSDEYFNTSDGSTETPIDMDGFKNVVGAIERTQGNIDMVLKRNWFTNLFRSGKAAGTEFSGKYNVLTNNCNDFVIAMAKAAGLTKVAEMHKSIFGPMIAYKNIRMAAEKGESESGTRVFFANKFGIFEKEYEKGNTLMNDFISRARFGMSKDGLNPARETEFMSLLDTVNREAPGIAEYVNKARAELRKPLEEQDFSFITDDTRAAVEHLSGSIRKAVECKTSKPHPKTTRYLLQLEAMARSIITMDDRPAAAKGIDNYDTAEVEYAIQTLTGSEKEARDKGKVDARSIFDNSNFGYGSTHVMGELMLHAIGASNLVVPFSAGWSGEKIPEAEKSNRLKTALSRLSGSANEGGKALIRDFMKPRDFMSSQHIAWTLTISMLSGMGQKSLPSNLAIGWRISLDAADRTQRIDRIKSTFLNEKNLSEDEKLERQIQYDTALQMADVFLAIVEEIRANEKAG